MLSYYGMTAAPRNGAQSNKCVISLPQADGGPRIRRANGFDVRSRIAGAAAADEPGGAAPPGAPAEVPRGGSWTGCTPLPMLGHR